MIEIPDNVVKVFALFGGLCLACASITGLVGFDDLYEKTKQMAIYAPIFAAIIILLVFIIKRIIENWWSRKAERSRLKIIRDYTTKEELPKNIEQYTTKKELPQEIKQSKTIDLSLPAKTKGLAEKKDITINLDPDVQFYNLKRLNEDEINYLKHKHFIIRKCFNPFTKRKDNYIFLKPVNEGERHFLITNIIVNYLKNKVDSLQTFKTVKPDIVFEFNNKRIALEIESGKVLKHNKKQLKEKVKALKENYDDWFFVVTNYNLCSRYRGFGKVLDLRYIKNEIDRLLKKYPL